MNLQTNFTCRLCKDTDLKLFYSLGQRGQFKYFRCRNCTLVNYDLSGGLDQSQYIDLTDPTDNRAQKNYDKDASWRFINKQIPKPGKFLDVGCGTGRLLYLAQNAGWDSHGLELSAEAAKTAINRLKVPVIIGDFLPLEAEPPK
jgi:SAM-dependent methyltransferase